MTLPPPPQIEKVMYGLNAHLLIVYCNICFVAAVYNLWCMYGFQSQRNVASVNRNNNATGTSSAPFPGMCSSRIAQTDSMCSSNVVYTQDACQHYLLTLQACLPNRQSSSDVYVSVTDQVETEGQVNLLLNSLRNFIRPSPECRAVVEPFLCLYLFGLCDSSGVAYEPSFEECVFISTGVCASEWARANNLLIQVGQSPLPECASFPSTTTDISGTLAVSQTVFRPASSSLTRIYACIHRCMCITWVYNVEHCGANVSKQYPAVRIELLYS